MSAPILAVDDIHVHIGKARVLRGVSFNVRAGEAVGLVGETGAGKTMVVRAVTGLLPSIGARVTAGSIAIDGDEAARATSRAWRKWQGKVLALVPQASMSSLSPVRRVRAQLAETIHCADRSMDVQAETRRLLASVHLPPAKQLLDSYPHELSGGMRQRVMIALALAVKPRLLVADEPTTALDASVRASILDLFTELRREQGLAVVMVSHDIAAIAASTDRTVVMYAGRSVESGATAEVISQPKHPYTVALLAAMPERTPPGQPLPVVSAARATSVAAGHGKAGAVTSAAAAIVATDLDFSYGKSGILHGIGLRVASGECLGIVGESGSGKTTLAKLLAGILRSDRVTVNGKPWAQWPRRSDARRAVQLVQQDPFASLTSHLSARSAVAEAARVSRRLRREEAQDLAADLLASVGISGDLSERRPSGLSGGQCQRVSIARALAVGPSVLVADEPTSALDLSVQAQLINLLLELSRSHGLGLVVISHDLAVIRHLTEQVIVMRHGRIVEQGATASVLGNPGHEYTRMLCKAGYALPGALLPGPGWPRAPVVACPGSWGKRIGSGTLLSQEAAVACH